MIRLLLSAALALLALTNWADARLLAFKPKYNSVVQASKKRDLQTNDLWRMLSKGIAKHKNVLTVSKNRTSAIGATSVQLELSVLGNMIKHQVARNHLNSKTERI
ncbi:hypothetical protein CAPTEDRAFT_190554 [Capitella teleta]|uniref:Uncharacterized protein n=1 Tax=Capitella teleta TaxID=283909 RepID=R7TMF7_CAPTE|nr:hypothetical protein CAPTEDRAFT_190554 [Capitella teleta]|eukprot:ELT92741.1 hypothetical protein CAPTEDRAFT_190554 [Capitella teleta]